MSTLKLAFDRANRTVDVDGRLHVAVSNMSKATVNPYRGNEIPDFERLGLDPDGVYKLLRDPKELAQAADTFNNLPVLIRHVPVSAEEHMPDLVVGSTGTDAAFNDPYLTNSAVIWAAAAIAGIESGEQKEWSCAYRYVADMTPGTYKGLRYDGIMRNIQGNHVALVEAGRAGSDVVVGDSQIKGPTMLKTRTALMLHGALLAYATPLLAADAKFDPRPALAGVTAKNLKAKAPKIAAAIVKMAADGDLDIAGVVDVIKAVQGVEGAPDEVDAITDPDDTPAVDADDDTVAKIMAFLKGKISDDDLAELTAMTGGGAPEAPAEDDAGADPPATPPGKDPKDKMPAMDAKSVTRIAQDAAAAVRRGFQELRVAERAVAPFIGQIPTDVTSASEVYKLALDSAGVDYAGVHESALPAMVGMLRAPGEGEERPTIAQDRQTVTDHAKVIPGFDRLNRRRA